MEARLCGMQHHSFGDAIISIDVFSAKITITKIMMKGECFQCIVI